MYVGSMKQETKKMFLYDAKFNKMINRKITFVPALLKIFDEILVNAADHRRRCGLTDKLSVEVDMKKGIISIKNNGGGIMVQKSKEHGIYAPEFIFGNLLVSENYDDTKIRYEAGRFGYGSKLTNIMSTKFTVDTNDPEHSGKYY